MAIVLRIKQASVMKIINFNKILLNMPFAEASLILLFGKFLLITLKMDMSKPRLPQINKTLTNKLARKMCRDTRTPNASLDTFPLRVKIKQQ